jgi:hypothetical protein
MIRYCRPCWREKGKPVPATEVVGEIPLCSEHFTKIDKENEEKMRADKVAVQKDRDAGMSPQELAAKYKVPVWWVYQNTKKAQSSGATQGKAGTASRDKNVSGAAECGESGNGGSRAVSRVAGRTGKTKNGKGTGESHSWVSEMIARLTVKKLEIEAVIEALQAIR